MLQPFELEQLMKERVREAERLAVPGEADGTAGIRGKEKAKVFILGLACGAGISLVVESGLF